MGLGTPYKIVVSKHSFFLNDCAMALFMFHAVPTSLESGLYQF